MFKLKARKEKLEKSKESIIPKDLRFVRTGEVRSNGISIRYMSKEHTERNLDFGCELTWIIKAFVNWYKIDDLILIRKIRQNFFKHFPEQKDIEDSDYIGLLYCTNKNTDEDPEVLLEKFDTKARAFLNETRRLCRNQTSTSKSKWLTKCEI